MSNKESRTRSQWRSAQSWYMKSVYIILVLFVLVGLFGPKPQTNNNQQATLSQTSTYITYEKFLAIKDGMSYEEVKQIIGSEGQILSENTTAGMKTIMYMRKGEKIGANANMMFQNNKLINKAQFMLNE